MDQGPSRKWRGDFLCYKTYRRIRFNQQPSFCWNTFWESCWMLRLFECAWMTGRTDAHTLFKYSTALILRVCRQARRLSTLFIHIHFPCACVTPYAMLWRSYCPTMHPTTYVASDLHPRSSLGPLRLSVSRVVSLATHKPLYTQHWFPRVTSLLVSVCVY